MNTKVYGLLIMAGLLLGFGIESHAEPRRGGNELVVENVTFTPCKDDRAKGLFKTTWLRIFLTDSGAVCSFLNLNHTCAFNNIHVEVDLKDSHLSIREYAEYEGEEEADCICQLDASFFIKNLEEGDYNLSIYNSNNVDARPYYKGMLNLTRDDSLIFVVEAHEDAPNGDSIACTGRIVPTHIFYFDSSYHHPDFGRVFGLQTTEKIYNLYHKDNQYFFMEAEDDESFVWQNMSYSVGDDVEVSGNLSVDGKVIEIRKMRKIDKVSREAAMLFEKGNVYYCASLQSIVFQEALWEEVQAVEVLSAQGQVVLHTERLSVGKVPVSTLPKGFYLYRIVMHGNRVLSGKFIR